jgi:hypothetical protein
LRAVAAGTAAVLAGRSVADAVAVELVELKNLVQKTLP